MMKLKYTIPIIPPSNNKYLGNGGQGKNLEYQAEKRQWAGYVNLFCKPTPPYPIARAKVLLHYFFKDGRRRDPDNYSGKFILDGLVKNKIIQDDSFKVIELELKADVDPAHQGYVEITITKISNAATDERQINNKTE